LSNFFFFDSAELINVTTLTGRSELDFRHIPDDPPFVVEAEPPPLIPRGFIRSISLGGETANTNLASLAEGEGVETDLDSLPENAQVAAEKIPHRHKKKERPKQDDGAASNTLQPNSLHTEQRRTKSLKKSLTGEKPERKKQ